MKIETIKKYGFAISIIAFPIMLQTGFLMHPNLLKLEALQTVEQLVGRFHNQPIYHIGHLIVMFAVPVIMIALISFMNVLQGKGRRLGFWGGIIGLFGAFILAVDKGALCLVLSAFDTLPKLSSKVCSFSWCYCKQSRYALGGLAVAIITSWCFNTGIGFIKGGIISRWQTVCIISGLLLLNNPDIEFISAISALPDVRRIHSMGCKNTSGQNEMFFNCLPDIRYKKE